MTALIVAEAVAILLLGLLVAGLLRSHAEILRKLHDLGVHVDDEDGERLIVAPDLAYAESVTPPRAAMTPAFDIAGSTPRADAIGISVAGETTLIAFLSSGCKTCKGFWEAFASHNEPGTVSGARLVIVTKDDADESPSKVGALAPPGVPVVMSSRAWLDYQVPGSPYFVLVDGDSGAIAGEGSAGTWDQLETLLAEAVADDRERRNRRKWRADAIREARADGELAAAGILPGHPSLYPEPEAKTEPQ